MVPVHGTAGRQYNTVCEATLTFGTFSRNPNVLLTYVPGEVLCLIATYINVLSMRSIGNNTRSSLKTKSALLVLPLQVFCIFTVNEQMQCRWPTSSTNLAPVYLSLDFNNRSSWYIQSNNIKLEKISRFLFYKGVITMICILKQKGDSNLQKINH